jgi:hypothetical protein
VNCQRVLGILPEAVDEAVALMQEDPTTENLLNLVNLYLATGDLLSLCTLAVRLAARPDLTAAQVLKLAGLTQLGDRQLAVSLWRRAVTMGLDDEAVGAALTRGHQLGLEGEVGSLSIRLSELATAGHPNVQPFSIGDFLAFVEQRREHLPSLPIVGETPETEEFVLRVEKDLSP